MIQKPPKGHEKVLMVLHAMEGDQGFVQTTENSEHAHEMEVICRASVFEIIDVTTEGNVKVCTIKKVSHSI